MNIDIYQLLAMLLDSLNPILQMSKEVICVGSHGYQMIQLRLESDPGIWAPGHHYVLQPFLRSPPHDTFPNFPRSLCWNSKAHCHHVSFFHSIWLWALTAERPYWALTEEATLSCMPGFYVILKYPYQIYAKHKTRTNDIALNKSAIGPNP